MKNTNKPRIAALVPMRHNSERVPGKNYRLLGGRPLYHHIVASLLECPYIAEICIDTDSPFILDDAPKHFPVRLIERPEHLRSGYEPMNNILLYDTARIEADLYLQTHSTNPLLTAETISKAIDTFMQPGDHDSLFGVTRLQTRLYDEQGNPFNHNPDELLRTQDLPPVFEENSTIYIFSKEILKERRNRIGYNPIMFEVSREEAVDINEEMDFILAEFLYKQNRKERAYSNEI
jgi:CMP-N-acetylneuraminic acid synthetase